MTTSIAHSIHLAIRAVVCPGPVVLNEPSFRGNYWLQTLLLDTYHTDQRDVVLEATNDAGFMKRPAWILMHELAPFKDCPRMDLAMARSLTHRLINIPSSSGLVTASP